MDGLVPPGTIHFYGWRTVSGERLARLAARPGSPQYHQLEAAGWRLVRPLQGSSYALWRPPAWHTPTLDTDHFGRPVIAIEAGA